MVSTDFNGDNFPDLAVTISDGDRISIRLNDGNGGFSSQQIDLPLPSTGRGRGPIALQAGRFNNNSLRSGRRQLFDGTVVVMLDFNGSDFASKTFFHVGSGPIDIAAGNFNNDVFSILAVVNSLSHTVSILLNNGSGGFTVSAPIASGGLQPIAIAVGHFNDDNGDGFNRDGDRLDIAVVNKNGQLATPGGGVSIFRGDGLGSFTFANKFSAGPNPVDIVVADFDLDTKATPDIAVNNQGALDLLTRSFSADQSTSFPEVLPVFLVIRRRPSERQVERSTSLPPMSKTTAISTLSRLTQLTAMFPFSETPRSRTCLPRLFALNRPKSSG